MKAVLLAGGLGTRMREETEFRPKPMVDVGGRPVLWHIMKILASHGIKEFIIAAGYKGQVIKNYFLSYAATNFDLTVNLGNPEHVVFHGNHAEEDWEVTVVDTGLETMTGGRLRRLQNFVGDGDFFMTYGDGIANVNVTALLDFHRAHGLTATMTVAKPTSRFGIVDSDESGVVSQFREKPKLGEWVNIGYMVLSPRVLELIHDDACVFEEGPLHSLAATKQLASFKHEGFWQPMDTHRELLLLNKLWANNQAPWNTAE